MVDVQVLGLPADPGNTDKQALKNRLFYGDNLDVLRRHIADGSVDLVYLDPPFNSSANYSVLFAEKTGKQAAAQIQAFEDTWRWDEGAARTFQEVVEQGGRVSQAMQAFRAFLGDTDMLAYLAMMAPRLVELRRVLKPTGCLYLHCDPNASHYLKMLLDAVFGPEHFLNEIIWKRTSARSDSHRYNGIHDTILFYSAGTAFTWNPQYQPYDEQYVSEFYTHVDPDGRRWKRGDLTSPNPRPNMMYQFKTYPSPKKGWRFTKARLEELDRQGKIHYPKAPHGVPRLK